MTRIQVVNERYAKSAELATRGVEVVTVVEPSGARLNSAVRSLLAMIADDGPELWEDLAGAAKSLRWRIITQPQPIALNPAVREGTQHVSSQTKRLRGAVGSKGQAVIDELALAAQAVRESESNVGSILLRSVEEVGASDCVVIAANARAQIGMQDWLAPLGFAVLTESQLLRSAMDVDQAYAVGPPRFFRPSLVNAPLTSQVSFLLPTWFADRSLPSRAMSKYAEKPLHIKVRVVTEGEESADVPPTDSELEIEDDVYPSPVWSKGDQRTREPTSDEVLARKVLLGGGFAIWLDDGERIRSLDLEQPSGSRVGYTDVQAVRPGVFLLLRNGETERHPLYLEALRLLGNAGSKVDASQQAWKEELTLRIAQHGYRAIVRELRAQGVMAAEQARAWTAPNLVRPQNDRDFDALLRWLGIPVQPAFAYASSLRRSLYRASVEIGDELEAAADIADLIVLEREGFLNLSINRPGFRGIVATRVLACSPNMEIVRRNEARIPLKDRSALWLE